MYFRNDLSEKREVLAERWQKLEKRRQARVDYYHAKIRHEQQLNGS